MRIGDVTYGCFANIDTFTEKTGAREFTVRLRDADSGKLLEQKLLPNYTLTEALAVARFVAETLLKKRT